MVPLLGNGVDCVGGRAYQVVRTGAAFAMASASVCVSGFLPCGPHEYRCAGVSSPQWFFFAHDKGRASGSRGRRIFNFLRHPHDFLEWLC